MQVAWVKIGDFQQIARYNSKTSTVAGVVNLVRSLPSCRHLVSYDDRLDDQREDYHDL